MPRDRAYSNASSSGYGSEDHPPSSANAPRRKRNTRQGTGRGGGGHGGGGHNGYNGHNGLNNHSNHSNGGALRNTRQGTGRGGGGGGYGGGGVGHNNHNNQNNGHGGHGHGHGGGHRYHEMTLLCHRVDLFDDFVPRKSGENSHGAVEGLVPIRCLTSDRGCACITPCTFCHTIVEDHDNDSNDHNHDGNHGGNPDNIKSTTGGGEAPPTDIHPNLAFLFAEKAEITKKPPLPCSKHDTKEGATTTTTTKSTITSTLVVDPIFAQNHGLLSDHVEGGVKVKKYHHPPVARYGFTPPLMELPKFFDEAAVVPVPIRNGHAECHAPNNNTGHESKTKAREPKETSRDRESNDDESKKEGAEEEEDCSELDSFFDDFAVAPKPPPPTKQQAKPKKHTDNDRQVLVFRAPLKTVVKKTITSSDNYNNHDNNNNKDQSDTVTNTKCLCRSRYENLMKGSTQLNPHDPSIVHDKYWAQRRRLFKKFDEGIQLDAEGWYSVTPEVVADHVASRFADAAARLVRSCDNYEARGGGGNRGNHRRGGGGGGSSGQSNQRTKQPPSKSMVILDAFCGCGGNAIAFAKLPPASVSLVVCIEIDRTKLRKAAHNASIYGIPPNRILFVEANSVAVMQRCYRDGNLIMDPPPRNRLSDYPPREVYDDFTIGGIDLLAEYAPHIDAVFMDPPWGGIDYGSTGKDGYDLSRDMRIRGCERGCVGFPPTPEVDGVHLLRIAAAATSTRFVAYDLPRNANKRSLAHAALEAGYEGNSKLEEHYLNGRLKTVTAYFGQDFRHLLDLKKYHR